MNWNLPYKYIIIEGNIGAGKTTLAKRMAEETGAHFLPERFEENPFLESFYADKIKYALDTELFFLNDRFSQIKNTFTNVRNTVISDFSFYKSKAFASINLNSTDLAAFNNVYQNYSREIPIPGLVIFLKTETENNLKNIQDRGRLYEQEIENVYLKKIDSAYEKLWQELPELNILIVDPQKIGFPYTNSSINDFLTQLISTEFKGITYF